QDHRRARRRTRRLRLQGQFQHGGPLAAVARWQGAGRNRHRRKQARRHGAEINRALWAGAAAIIAVATGAFVASIGLRPDATPPLVSAARAADGSATVYYQDPGGKPRYSLTPMKAPDGRDWRAVPASADISFDAPGQPPVETKAADAKGERGIKYYRNPMGLPDTSPVPKKDSMGMDYIPVYEGE